MAELRRKEDRRINRHAVHVDLKVDMRTGRQARRADKPDYLTRRYRRARANRKPRQVAVQDADADAGDHQNVVTGAGGVVARDRFARRRRIDIGADRCGQVDACVYVVMTAPMTTVATGSRM